jgi:hypothetical protein
LASLEFDRIGDEWDLRSENGKLVSLYRTAFLDKIHGIGILPACQVVYADGPEVVGGLFDFVIAVYDKGKVRSKIVGYPVLVPLGIVKPR